MIKQAQLRLLKTKHKKQTNEKKTEYKKPDESVHIILAILASRLYFKV